MEIELENIHLAVLELTAVAILYADHQGFAYLTGKTPLLNRRSIVWPHRLIIGGLMLMIVTGIGLTVPTWEYRFSDPVFYVKMGFVLTLVLNGFAIGKLSRVASERPFMELDTETKRTLLISGALSAIGWVGAALIGFFFL
jgi:hypothetical protein